MWFRGAKIILQHSELLPKNSQLPWKFSSHALYSGTTFKMSKAAPLQERRMIDRFRLYAKGGDGGIGCCSFRRSRHDRRGKPDGGNGGRGGDVILQCSPAIWDFSSLQHHINAKKGGNGGSKNRIGTRGADKVVQVPVGTVIHLVSGELPALLEKPPTSADLDPWDVPGILSENPECSETSVSVEVDAVGTRDEKVGFPFHHAKNVGCKPYSMRRPSRGLSTECWDEDEDLGADNETEADSWLSEGEWEEEFQEESENIEYNVAELTEEGQQILVACGGDGGLGNVCTAKGSKKPKFVTTKAQTDDAVDGAESDDEETSVRAGFPGSQTVLILELKSIADVGLVGMPNAGKSTLLGAISKAKPAVGHYAFTTLRPNLGNLNYDDFSVTVADIPGIIKGAHENRGLGHAFLRHIERTKVLAFVVDLAAGLDGRKGIPPWEQLRDLVLELESHQEGLSNRPCLIVANKIDEAGAEGVYEELKNRVQGVPIFPVCAVLEEGISELKDGLRMLVNGGKSHKLSLHKLVVD